MWDYLKSIDEKAYEKHRQWMQLALNLAATAGDRGDVPVGAVIVDKQGHLIAQVQCHQLPQGVCICDLGTMVASFRDYVFHLESAMLSVLFWLASQC